MKELLLNVLESPNKTVELNDKFFVEHVEIDDDLDLIIVNLRKDKNIYKGIAMEKGLTYPVPREGDIILAKTMYLKYNSLFILKLYINGNIFDKEEEINSEDVQSVFSFEENYIFQTISSILGINIINSCSTIFVVKKIIGNYSELKSLCDSKQYELSFLELNTVPIKKFEENSFLWINFHELKNDKVVHNKLTTYETLNNEQIARILNLTYFNNLSLFKVIDINEDTIIVININFKILNLRKNDIKLKDLNIELCSLLIISIYKEEKDEIVLLNNSSIFILNQEFHYLDISINSKAILKLYILDYKKNSNKYDAIIICAENKKIIISNNEVYLFINYAFPKIYEFFPCKLKMINNKNEKIKPITFTVYAYNGLLNKINTFLNTDCPNSYFYEYFYYNITQPLKEIKKKIMVNNNEYDIKFHDTFSSKNRKRICLLNIPYQNIITFEKELVNNSIQVNELFLEDKSVIVGINDIDSIEIKKPISNSYFNEFYSDFGDIFDNIKLCPLIDRKKMLITLDPKISKINKINFINDFIEINNFDNSMTLSQFKTWVGLIVCYYLSCYGKKQLRVLNTIAYIFSILLEEKLNYYDFIRIFIFYIKEFIVNENVSNVKLIFVSKLDELSPYLLAYKFNKEQINNLHECHSLFQAYLQFDSYESYNYIHKQKSYTFSLEMNFMVKHQLLSAYEDFFFIKRTPSKEYAYLDYTTKITVVNEFSIYEDNDKDINNIYDIKEAKNCAIPMVINFSHEKSGHHKFMLKNDSNSSPILYFKGLRTQLEISISNDSFTGETGKIIENFICEDAKIIEELSTNFIYGDLLEGKYFDGEENILKDAVLNILESYLKKIKQNQYGNLRLTIKKDKNENKIEGKAYAELPHFRLYGCIMIDENSIKKRLTISKEKKEEMDKINYEKQIDKFEKMRQRFNESKKLFESKNYKK